MPQVQKDYDVRTVAVAVMPTGARVCHGSSITVSIADQGVGEYVTIQQQDYDRVVAIAPAEWPFLRSVIDGMIGECRPGNEA